MHREVSYFPKVMQLEILRTYVETKAKRDCIIFHRLDDSLKEKVKITSSGPNSRSFAHLTTCKFLRVNFKLSN